MIVGADGADDGDIILTSAKLYTGYGLRRVYYSAFSPIPDSSRDLPLIAPPLVREHRLYQADWLMRFYGFAAQEDCARGPARPAHAVAGTRPQAGLGLGASRMLPRQPQHRCTRAAAARAGAGRAVRPETAGCPPLAHAAPQ